MRRRYRRLISSSAKLASLPKRASLLVGLTITWLVTVPAPVPAQKLRVGVAGSAPFVIKDGDEFKGISLDIWKEIARDQGFNYELIPQPRVQSGQTSPHNQIQLGVSNSDYGAMMDMEYKCFRKFCHEIIYF